MKYMQRREEAAKNVLARSVPMEDDQNLETGKGAMQFVTERERVWANSFCLDCRALGSLF